MFTISFDRESRLLRLTLSGFWDEATFADFREQLGVTIAPAGCHTPRFGTLSDIRDFPVQFPATIAAFAALAAAVAHNRHGRVAQVARGVLSKLQAERTLPLDDVRVFLDEAEALAWLAEGR